MKRIVHIVLCLLIFLCSCGNKEGALSIDAIKEVPEDCKEAGCSFSDVEHRDQPIMMSGASDETYLCVNGKVVGFALVKSTPTAINDSTTNYIETYKYKDLELKIQMNQTHDGSEEDTFEGTITIQNKKGETVTKKFVGGCSC